MLLSCSWRFIKTYNHGRLMKKFNRLFAGLEKKNFNELILKNTKLTEDHLTPEMKLRLITPECEIWHTKYTDSMFPNDPFWGFYWPGGQALSRFLLDNKETVNGKNVIDIGSGSGACAIAAAMSGAKFTVANDTDALSIAAIGINSQLNNVHINTCQSNLIGRNVDSLVDNETDSIIKMSNIILIGDMFYDNEFSSELFKWLIYMVKKGKKVFIGDPGRYALKNLKNLNAYGELVLIAEYKFTKIEHNGFPTAAVYKVIQTSFEVEKFILYGKRIRQIFDGLKRS